MLAPGWYPDYSTIARFCNEKGAFDLALAAARAGLARNPRDPLLHLRVAQSHDGRGEPDAVLAHCATALGLAPSADVRAQILATEALAHESRGAIDAAVASVAAAIATAPAAVEPHLVAAGIAGRGGDYRALWREVAFAFLDERAWFRRRFGGPEWNGDDLAGRRLIVVNGQGVGDLIQMLRYLPVLRSRAGSVLVEATPALLPLLRGGDGVAYAAKDTVVRGGDDAYVRAMALPGLLEETAATPAPAYLAPDAARVERWRDRLGPRPAPLRVGLVWAGNPYHSNDHFRSLSLAAFAPFAGLAGVEWVALQVGPRAYDPAPPGMQLRRLHDEIRDFADTAAIVAVCDLVVAVDTAVAHLAGALGAPVWLLLPARPEWRWPRAGTTSPWYASMTLVHAGPAGWPAALGRAAAMLRERVATSASP